MRILMLDTLQEKELPHFEACAAIDAGVAVEAPLGTDIQSREFDRTEIAEVFSVPTPPETATLDRSANTMQKPRPQPRTAPPREKRRKKR
jgi:hypothetical protein